jgi:hypothetical protein
MKTRRTSSLVLLHCESCLGASASLSLQLILISNSHRGPLDILLVRILMVSGLVFALEAGHHD